MKKLLFLVFMTFLSLFGNNRSRNLEILNSPFYESCLIEMSDRTQSQLDKFQNKVFNCIVRNIIKCKKTQKQSYVDHHKAVIKNSINYILERDGMVWPETERYSDLLAMEDAFYEISYFNDIVLAYHSIVDEMAVRAKPLICMDHPGYQAIYENFNADNN